MGAASAWLEETEVEVEVEEAEEAADAWLLLWEPSLSERGGHL